MKYNGEGWEESDSSSFTLGYGYHGDFVITTQTCLHYKLVSLIDKPFSK